jgi:HK97 gp10 family phage protein
MGEIITGIDELRAAFNKLDISLRQKGARRIVASGAGVLRKEAKAIVSAKRLIKSGDMLKNIAIKREPKVPPGVEQYNLGVRHGRDLRAKSGKYFVLGKNGKIRTRRFNDPYYWKWVEFGHRVVPRSSGRGGILGSYYERTRGGKLRLVRRKVGADALSVRRRSPVGFIEGTPFISRSLETKKQEALNEMEKSAQRFLELSKK